MTAIPTETAPPPSTPERAESERTGSAVHEAIVSAARALYTRLEELEEADWYAAMSANDPAEGREEWVRLVADHFSRFLL